MSRRRSRTGLLIGAVALSAALIVSVACAIASANNTLRRHMEATVGAADLRIKPAGGGKTLDAGLLDVVRAWPEVASAEGRLQASVWFSVKRPVLVESGKGDGPEAHTTSPSETFRKREIAFESTALATSVSAGEGAVVNGMKIVVGRAPSAAGEVVLDALLADRLSYDPTPPEKRAEGFQLPDLSRIRKNAGAAREAVPDAVIGRDEAERLNLLQRVAVGDGVEVVKQVFSGPFQSSAVEAAAARLRKRESVKVVGLAETPPLGGRPQCVMTLETLAALSGERGRVSYIDLVVREGVDPEAVARARRGEMPVGVLLETSARITSGAEKNMASSELGFALASLLAFLSAAFIVMTGLTTNIAERRRELAVLRCIGAARGQLAWSQVCVGLIVGAAGAAIGVPLGIGIAAGIAWFYRDLLPVALSIPASSLMLGAGGSVLSGLLGAALPAWQAARQSPLEGLASRSEPPTVRGIRIITLAGLAGVLVQAVVIGVPRDGQVMFWAYATVGLPAMFVGYFLLGVPAVMLVSRALAGAVSRVLGLPRRVLGRTVAATPYRHGFVAGALMTGLALMISIWVNGGSVLKDWLGRINFPDAFVSGLDLTPQARAKIDSLPFVERTCAISLLPVETDVFGVRALQSYKTNFIAFEPEPFFRMMQVKWVQGDQETAIRRLNEGGAVIVAREFLTARGMGVGSTFAAKQGGQEFRFEIVGVVTSPGLEIISKFFNIGEDYTDQSLHAVFGSRRDLKEKFGTDAIQLIQIDLKDDPSDPMDARAIAKVRQELRGYAILDAGSGRAIKEQVLGFAHATLLVFSAVAVVGMLVACLGVANLIIAGVDARRFEFGVLRAVGASRSLPARLVLGEAVLIAAAACVLGTLMGVQGSWAGQRLYALLLGLDLRLRLPLAPTLVGWGIVAVFALAAAAPAAWRLARRPVRELLGAMKG